MAVKLEEVNTSLKGFIKTIDEINHLKIVLEENTEKLKPINELTESIEKQNQALKAAIKKDMHDLQNQSENNINQLHEKLRMDIEYNLKSIKDKLEDRYQDTQSFIAKALKEQTESLHAQHKENIQLILELKSTQKDQYKNLRSNQQELKQNQTNYIEELVTTKNELNTRLTNQNKLIISSMTLSIILLIIITVLMTI